MASGQAGQDAEPKKTLAEIENERITRRAALRKFGFGAGMAALMAMSVDDLARMAAVKLQQNAGDNQVANAVAKEFKNAGLALASGSDGDEAVGDEEDVATPVPVNWQDLPFSPACQDCYRNQGTGYDACGTNVTCKNTVNTQFANCYSAAHCNFNYGN